MSLARRDVLSRDIAAALGHDVAMLEVPEDHATPVASVEEDDDAAGDASRAPVLAVVLGILTVVLTVGSVLLGLADGVAPEAAGAAGAVFGVTGGLVAQRRPRLVVGWLLLVVGVAFTLSAFCLDWARHTLLVDPGSLPAGEAALWLGTWVWVVGYCALAALLPLRLPDGARPTGAWRFVWRVSLGVTALAAAAGPARLRPARPPAGRRARRLGRLPDRHDLRADAARRLAPAARGLLARGSGLARAAPAPLGRSRSASRRSGSCGAPC